MTIVIRPVWEPWTVDVGGPGVVRAAVGDVVGSFGTGPWRVEYLSAEVTDDDPRPDRRLRAEAVCVVGDDGR